MARKAKKSAPRRKRAAAAARAPAKHPAKVNGAHDTLREVEQFLYHQAELLEEQRWDDFIELFAADGLYWMPAAPEQTTGEGVPSIFYEDRNLMTVRMKRVTHPHAWSQSPAWGSSAWLRAPPRPGWSSPPSRWPRRSSTQPSICAWAATCTCSSSGI